MTIKNRRYTKKITKHLGVIGLLTALSQPTNLVAKTDARICNALRTLNKNRMRNKHADTRTVWGGNHERSL